MRAGRLRERVTISSPAGVDDGYGGQSAATSTDATVWAAVRATSGNEGPLTGALEGSTTYEVTIRYRSGVSPADVLTWGSKTLQIVDVIPDPLKSFIRLSCVERRAAGT